MFKELESENLILESINHDDDQFLFDLFSSELITHYLGDFPKINNIKESYKFINRYLSADSKVKHIYVVSLKGSNEKIGIVYLAHLDTLTSTIEINCSILPSFWKKGYASEAIERVLQFVKEDLNINLAYTYLDPNNFAGSRTLQKLGFYKTNEQRYVKASNIASLHDIYARCLYTKNSWQREFLGEGANVSDSQLVVKAKEDYKINQSTENNIKLVNYLYAQFKYHDALSYIKDDETNEELLYKKALICMKINNNSQANKILDYLFNNFKRLNYCYKLILSFYYMGEYKKAYQLALDWYDLFEQDDEKMAVLFWIMACSIKLGFDNSVVKKLFFKYKGELKTGYYLAIKQYLFDNVEIDLENMNDVHRSVIYYAASLLDEENKKMYLDKTLECINPWGSSCFLAALYERK